MVDLPDSPFWRRFNGRFSGVLTWSAMDELWDTLRNNPEGWHVFDLQCPPSTETLSARAFEDFLEEVSQYARARHDHDYCGFIYVDDAKAPSFVKIFDPRGMGSSCGGGGRIYPRWTISRLAPDPLPTPKIEPGEKGFLTRLFNLG